jgi:alanine racemase
MMVDRRSFIRGTLGTAGAGLLSGGSSRRVTTAARRERAAAYDPWIEVDPSVLGSNARELRRLAGGRAVLGVAKNNAYGLGLSTAGPVLDRADAIAALAVVKADEAVTLREAGVRKPILLMAHFDRETGAEMVARDVRLAAYLPDAGPIAAELARRFGRPVPVHVYLDTGMSRMGMSFRQAIPWIGEVAATPGVRIEGTFTELAESEFDNTQVERFTALAEEVSRRGIGLGTLHAASSHGIFLRPAALLDMVRPGLTLYGARPSEVAHDDAGGLRPAFRLRARVIRVTRLEPGDGVSYGRNYVAERPVWIAVLPVGHADGYPRTAVRGCEVVIRDRAYRVIGAVSASHTIVEVGDEPRVRVGDVATIVGPDHPAIHPNEVARRAGVSVYDILMHLSVGLPRTVGLGS